MVHAWLSRIALFAYRSFVRVTSKGFSLAISGAFARFGHHSTLVCPIRLHGEARISIGDRVFIGAGSWLQTLPDADNQSTAIFIGSGTSMVGGCTVSAVRQVVIENDVLFARNVYVSDHSHRYTDVTRPVLSQGIDGIAAVRIRQGAWLGENVVVCPGVTIGRGSVIGANSVVTRSIPDFTVAVGSPARVIKVIASDTEPHDSSLVTAGSSAR